MRWISVEVRLVLPGNVSDKIFDRYKHEEVTSSSQIALVALSVTLTKSPSM